MTITGKEGEVVEKSPEWSKERIQAEMKDLENAHNIRYLCAVILGGAGIGAILAPAGMTAFNRWLTRPEHTRVSDVSEEVSEEFLVKGGVSDQWHPKN